MVQFSKNFWNETDVLVTGGASFIGSHLVDRLVSLGAMSVLQTILALEKWITWNNQKTRLNS